MEVTLWGAFIAGILSFLSPCVLPLVPPYLCYIGGVTIDQLVGESSTKERLFSRITFTALAFVLGFSSVFVAFGASASLIGQLIIEYGDILGKFAGTIIIILGLHFIGLFRIALLYREARFQTDTKPRGILGAYIVGLAFAFGWTPCVGPVLAAVLFFAGSEDTLGQGAILLASYSLGIGIPFIAAAIMFPMFQNSFRKLGPYMGRIEKIIGALLVLTGIAFLTGSIADVANWMLLTFPSLGRVG